MEPLPAAGEFVRGQMHHVEGVHDLGGIREHLIDGGGVTGEAVHGHHLYLFPESRLTLVQPGAQHLCTAAGAHVQQSGRPTPIDQGCQVHQDRHKRRWLAWAAGVLPYVFVHPEDPHPVQVGGVVVDQLAAGLEGDLIDQLPTHPEGFRGGRHAHPVDREAL